MQTVLLIPGFQENIDSRDYRKTMAAIRSVGYDVKFVPITWTRTTIKQWLEELHAVYQKYDPTRTILAGFSFGAITAFVEATKRPPTALWLFSLSPYLAEDQASNGFKPSWRRSIGHRRADSFKALHFTSLIQHLSSSDVIFFYGDKELKTWPDIQYRHDTLAMLPGVREIFIPEAKHDITSDAYVQAIKESIGGHA